MSQEHVVQDDFSARTLLANGLAISAGVIFLVGFVLLPTLLMCILSPVAGLCTLAVCALFAPLYFVPALVALIGGKKHLLPIFLLDLCLGWTFVGWVGALIWAIMGKSEPQRRKFSISAGPLVLAWRFTVAKLQHKRNQKILFWTTAALIGFPAVDVLLAQHGFISPWRYAFDLVLATLGLYRGY